MIIDVSKHNGPIDWRRVRAAGVECAVMRCSLGLAMDPRFVDNWFDSQDAGIPRRGVYHYYVTEPAPLAQLAALLAATAGHFGNEPITIDCERRADERLRPFDRARYTFNLRTFLVALASVTVTPIRIYTSAVEWRAMTTLPTWAGDYPLWVAGYPFDPDSTTYRPDVPPGWARWARWQYRVDGRVDGIDGNVDMNRDANPPPVPAPDPAVAAVLAQADAITTANGEIRNLLR